MSDEINDYEDDSLWIIVIGYTLFVILVTVALMYIGHLILSPETCVGL